MEQIIRIVIYVLIIGVFIFNTWLQNLNYKNRNAEIPKEVSDIYNKEDYKKWLDYTMENHRFGMITSSVSTLIFLVLLAFGLFPVFASILSGVGHDGLRAVLFLGIYFGIDIIIGIPFSYYRIFTIEEKYGFNKTTKKTFVFDLIKRIILTAIFGGGLVYLVFVINKYAGNMFFVYTWAAIVFILLIVNIIYTRFLVPIFNKLTPLEDGELKDMINEFASSVGYEVTKISVMDASKRSTKLNAFFSGFGKFKQVVLYDTLIEKMSNEEIVAVLAHEIGHSKHKHILFNLVQMAITMLIYIGALGLVLRVPEFSTAFGLDDTMANFSDFHFAFALVLFGILLSPLDVIIGLITSYYSRKHEYQADNYAATKFKDEPMITALKVLSKENFSNLTPHPLYVKLRYSHPPTASRIKAIKEGVKDE